jgi:hypothetical protein
VVVVKGISGVTEKSFNKRKHLDQFSNASNCFARALGLRIKVMTDHSNTARTIGVFDSGVGGLSVLKAIRASDPSVDLIYIADSGNAPYGNRSAQFIELRAQHIARSLVSAGAQVIVVACNTATAVAVQTLRSELTIPVVAMRYKGSEPFKSNTATRFRRPIRRL